MRMEAALMLIETCGPRFVALTGPSWPYGEPLSHLAPFDMAKQIAQSAATILLEISLIRFAFCYGVFFL